MKGRYFSAIIRPSKFREDGRILEELEEKKEKKRITVLFNPIGNPFSNSCNNNYLFVRTNQPMAQAKKKQLQLPKLLLI